MTTYIEIWKRFSEAFDRATIEHGTKKRAAESCNIPYSNLIRCLREPEERRLRIEWVATLCIELGISVEYVMIGRGKMFT